MKKLTWLTAFALVFAANPLAAQERTDSTGCGLGSVLFEGKSGTAPQVLAVTTNGTFGNQTFGITSGTLGCNQHGTVNPPQEAALFTSANMDRLAQDMARGHGETIASLAEAIGVEADDRPAFYAAAQTNFGRIFPKEDVTSSEVLQSLYMVMAEDSRLSRYATPRES